MDPLNLLLLLGAGLAAGFVAGLIGVGGGVIFAPVLFFYFQGIGIGGEVIAQLTIGTSLFCTLLAAVASSWFQYQRNAVVTRIALSAGLFSAVAVFLMTRFVTTQPWYDGTVFQIVFSLVLLVVVARMLVKRGEVMEESQHHTRGDRWPTLVATGTVAGAVASAAGVGGGVVLVPAYHNFLGLPIHVSVGTSSATIVLISIVGIVNYAVLGWNAAVPASSLGYVDVLHALVLAIPSVLTARLGVWTAHRIDTRALRMSFAVIAALIALRLIWRAL